MKYLLILTMLTITNTVSAKTNKQALPPWLRHSLPGTPSVAEWKRSTEKQKLATVGRIFILQHPELLVSIAQKVNSMSEYDQFLESRTHIVLYCLNESLSRLLPNETVYKFTPLHDLVAICGKDIK